MANFYRETIVRSHVYEGKNDGLLFPHQSTGHIQWEIAPTADGPWSPIKSPFSKDASFGGIQTCADGVLQPKG